MIHHVHFGAFTVDLKAGELYKQGHKVKLQEKPFQILAALLAQPGEVVTREELRQKLWPAGVFVEFDHNLKTAISKVREALGDSAGSPRFVETLARRGYRFIAPVEAPAWTPPPAPLARRGDRVMLAVLPFENLTGNAAEDHFSDGLTEEMIVQLGAIEPDQLGVIARSSAMRYKGTSKGIDQIGRELNVRHIVEGSIRRAGSRVRITAQLIKVHDQTHVWAESYERDLRDILALQRQVARAITNQIRARLAPPPEGALARSQSVDAEASEAYLKGRHLLDQRREEGVEKSIQLFQRAIERDPVYTLAYAGLADAYRLLAVFGSAPPWKVMPKAKAAAVRALEIDPSLAEAHTSLAAVKCRFEWNWEESEREFHRAFELKPGYAEAHRAYAIHLQALGRLEEAIAESQRAHELDPLSLMLKGFLGRACYFARRYDDAINHYLESLASDANSPLVLLYLGRAYLQKGNYSQAIAELEKAVLLSHRRTPYLAGLGNAYAISGKRRKAQSILRELMRLSKQRYVCPYDLATVCAGLGDTDEVLEWLEKARENRSVRLVQVNADPVFDGLRANPRFVALLRRMGLPGFPDAPHTPELEQMASSYGTRPLQLDVRRAVGTPRPVLPSRRSSALAIKGHPDLSATRMPDRGTH